MSQIQLSPLTPVRFPTVEWVSIVKGTPINLDNVFSSLYLVHSSKENLGCLGGIKISLEKVDPAKQVQNAAEWSSAWKFAARAYTFILEHQHQELQDYGEWIEWAFSSRFTKSTPKIIMLDKAIWNFVASGQWYVVTNTTQFSHIYNTILTFNRMDWIMS